MKIAIVQSRPYQAFHGGDGAYIDGVIRHLEKSGALVRGYTSGTTKGRPRLTLRLAYADAKGRPWRFRSTLRFGKTYFAAWPQLLRDVWEFLRLRRAPPAERQLAAFVTPLDRNEERWICKELLDEKPDVAILCFEAAAHAAAVRRLGVKALALVGFLPTREYALAGAGAETDLTAGEAKGFLESLHEADFVSFNSRDDCDYARANLGLADPLFIGMGFPEQVRRREVRRPRLLFVGNKTAANHEAIGWFLDEVWAAVLMAVPEARFRIVGRCGHYFQVRSSPGVEFAGEVKSLGQEYCDARVVVAPLRTGSRGVKTKVAEAISYGCPVVTTSLGVDTADVGQLDRAGFVEDDPKAFAARVIQLLLDDGVWNAKQAGASLVFEALYSSTAAYRDLDRALQWIGETKHSASSKVA